MKGFLKGLTGWFGYDRRERRASFILILILAGAVAVRFSIREKEDIPEVVLFAYQQTENNASVTVSPAMSQEVHPREARVPSSSRVARPLNLNLCDSADLERLPGIGPVLSARIIKYRNLLGGYADKSQLLEVYGLRDSVYRIISSRIEADTTLLRRLNVNSAGYADLLRHPYLESEHVKAIVEYREQTGNIQGWKVLEDNAMVPPERAYLLRYYITF